MNLDRITGTIAIAVLPQVDGRYLCEVTPSFSDSPSEDIQCYGQTQEYAIAIAIKQLAEIYRQMAEERQRLDWDAVNRFKTGAPIEKQYHVMLQYEDTITAESKFEAMHNTIASNTVVENAKITVIGIADVYLLSY